MGICGNGNKENILNEENKNFDFEEYREIVRERKEENIFEICANFYLLTKLNNRQTRKSLISKYFFFQPNGKFETRVKKDKIADTFFEGTYDSKSRIFTVKSSEQILDGNNKLVKIYSGALTYNENGMEVQGEVEEDIAEKKKLANQRFEIDFTSCLWRGFYLHKNKQFDVKAFITFENFVYTGIAYDDNGVSLFRGVDDEKDNNKTKLTQVYIAGDIGNESKNSFAYIGTKDSIENKFVGKVTNNMLDPNTEFQFLIMGNPKEIKKK